MINRDYASHQVCVISNYLIKGLSYDYQRYSDMQKAEVSIRRGGSESYFVTSTKDLTAVKTSILRVDVGIYTKKRLVTIDKSDKRIDNDD